MGLFGPKEERKCCICSTPTTKYKKLASNGALCKECQSTTSLLEPYFERDIDPDPGLIKGYLLGDGSEDVRYIKGSDTAETVKGLVEPYQRFFDRKKIFTETESFECTKPGYGGSTDPCIFIFHADRINQLWYLQYTLPEYREADQGTSFLIHSFDELEDYFVIEDGVNVTDTKKRWVGRTAVGGLLFGSTGALVGAVTGKSKSTSTETINNQYVALVMNSPYYTCTISFVPHGVKMPIKRASFDFGNTQSKTNKFIAFLDEMKMGADSIGNEETSEDLKQPDCVNTNISTADEILKFKNLLDSGIITEEEFDTKKRQLLGI